jgi:excisionase family DNA binding protein
VTVNGRRVTYSPQEAAALIGCTRQHIHNMIASGEIPSMQLGRRRLIPASFIDNLYMGLDKKPPDPHPKPPQPPSTPPPKDAS